MFRHASNTAVEQIARGVRASGAYPDAAASADIADNIPESIIASFLVKFESGGATRQLVKPGAFRGIARICAKADKNYFATKPYSVQRKPADLNATSAPICAAVRAICNVNLQMAKSTAPRRRSAFMLVDAETVLQDDATPWIMVDGNMTDYTKPMQRYDQVEAGDGRIARYKRKSDILTILGQRAKTDAISAKITKMSAILIGLADQGDTVRTLGIALPADWGTKCNLASLRVISPNIGARRVASALAGRTYMATPPVSITMCTFSTSETHPNPRCPTQRPPATMPN